MAVSTPMTEGIRTVAVLGAGSMGHGIAELAAIAGYDVVLRDVDEEIVEDGYDQIAWSLGKLEESGMLEGDAQDVLSRIDTEVDLEAAVADADLVIEAAPERLDLKDIHVQRAKDLGVAVVISTDAHSTNNLEYMRYGVDQARRGWLEKGDVLNTRTLKQFRKWLEK